MIRTNLLKKAAEYITGDRNNHYGPPHIDFQRTGELWTTYLGGKKKVNAHDVAVMMALLKISRIAWSPDKADHWVDLAGYAACGLEAYAYTNNKVEQYEDEIL
jgi:hypothetical protein